MAGFLFFTSTGRDDSHITYWPAYTLSNFGEILNYNGDRVEQSSSLLQVLFLAFANKLSGLDIVLLGKLSSIVFGIASLIVVYRLALKIDKKTALPAAVLAGAALFFVYWSFSGMETTMAAFTGLLLIVTYANFLIKKSFSFLTLANACMATIMFILVRPEEPIVLIMVIAGTFVILLVKKRRIRGGQESPNNLNIQLSRLLLLAGLSLLFIATLFLFRHWYFNSWFPQPVYAKSSGLSLDATRNGVEYLVFLFKRTGWPTALLLLLATVAFFYTLWKQRKLEKVGTPSILAVTYVIVCTAFVVFGGGDWMEYGRLVTPFLPVALMFIPLAFVNQPKLRRFFNPLMLAVIALALFGTAYSLKVFSTGIPAWSRAITDIDVSEYQWFERRNKVNLRDINILINLQRAIADVAERKDGPINISSGEMGLIPYYAAKDNYGKVKFLDRVGLTDKTIIGCKELQFEKNWHGLDISYSKYFSDKEILERECGAIEPDIIFGLMNESAETVAQNGYVVLYNQGSYTISGLFGKQSVQTEEFVAVKRDLLDPGV